MTQLRHDLGGNTYWNNVACLTLTFALFTLLSMKTTTTTMIRNVPVDLWQAFKVQCVQNDISMNQKVLDLVRTSVEAEAEDQVHIAQAFAKGLKRVAE